MERKLIGIELTLAKEVLRQRSLTLTREILVVVFILASSLSCILLAALANSSALIPSSDELLLTCFVLFWSRSSLSLLLVFYGV